MVLLGTLTAVSVVVSAALLEVVTGYLYDRSSWANGKRMVAWYMGQEGHIRLDRKAAEPTSIVPHPYLLYTRAEFGGRRVSANQFAGIQEPGVLDCQAG